ncbi:MAG: hypothetical protein V2I33_00825, partial [Kangiellaceae bacterium]|nr:hypothetical protein [Kangiellaceae bacterium]
MNYIKPARALIWELFFRNSMMFLVIAAAAPFLTLVIDYLVTDVELARLMTTLKPMALGIMMMFFLMIFSYSQFDSKNYQAGFPKHVM